MFNVWVLECLRLFPVYKNVTGGGHHLTSEPEPGDFSSVVAVLPPVHILFKGSVCVWQEVGSKPDTKRVRETERESA